MNTRVLHQYKHFVTKGVRQGGSFFIAVSVVALSGLQPS